MPSDDALADGSEFVGGHGVIERAHLEVIGNALLALGQAAGRHTDGRIRSWPDLTRRASSVRLGSFRQACAVLSRATRSKPLVGNLRRGMYLERAWRRVGGRIDIDVENHSAAFDAFGFENEGCNSKMRPMHLFHPENFRCAHGMFERLVPQPPAGARRETRTPTRASIRRTPGLAPWAL